MREGGVAEKEVREGGRSSRGGSEGGREGGVAEEEVREGGRSSRGGSEGGREE